MPDCFFINTGSGPFRPSRKPIAARGTGLGVAFRTAATDLTRVPRAGAFLALMGVDTGFGFDAVPFFGVLPVVVAMINFLVSVSLDWLVPHCRQHDEQQCRERPT